MHNIGGENLPVVVAARLDGNMDFNPQFMPDYVYVGRQLPESPIEGIQYIIDADLWEGQTNTWPAFKGEQLPFISGCSASLKFLFITYMGLNDEVIAGLKYHPEVVLVAQSNHPNRLGEYRALAHQLMNEGLKNPLVFFQHYAEIETENLQKSNRLLIWGALIIDGLCDGIFLFNQTGKKEGGKAINDKVVDTTAFRYPAGRAHPYQQNRIYILSGMRPYALRPRKHHCPHQASYITPERTQNRNHGLHSQRSR